MAAILLAGCAANAPAPTATPGVTPGPGSPPGTLRFAPAVEMPFDGNGQKTGFEPSVVADGKGNVVVTAARGVIVGDEPQASWLWVSNDDGSTFRAVPPVDGANAGSSPEGAEGALAKNADGTFYFAELTLGSVTVSRSTDGGKTWELRSPSANAAPGGDRQWIAAGAGENVYAAWNQIPSGYWVFASEDGGRTWPTQTMFDNTGVVSDPSKPGGQDSAGTLAVAPDGTVYAARNEDGPAVYFSKDAAKTFTRTLAWSSTTDVGYLFTTVATDAANAVYVATVEDVGGTTRVRYAASTDGGKTFTEPREIASPGVHAMAWAASGPAGRLAIAYYANPTATGIPDEAKGDWFIRAVVIDDAASPSPKFSDVLVSDVPVTSGAVCTSGLNCPNEIRGLGDYLGCDVAPDGSVHVSWTVSEGEGGKVYYARTP